MFFFCSFWDIIIFLKKEKSKIQFNPKWILKGPIRPSLLPKRYSNLSPVKRFPWKSFLTLKIKNLCICQQKQCKLLITKYIWFFNHKQVSNKFFLQFCHEDTVNVRKPNVRNLNNAKNWTFAGLDLDVRAVRFVRSLGLRFLALS